MGGVGGNFLFDELGCWFGDFLEQLLGFDVCYLFLFFFVFIVASGVICFMALDHFICYTDDHYEPNKKNDLEGQEEREESPADIIVHADETFWVVEWLNQMVPVVGDRKGSFKITVGTTETAIVHDFGYLGVDGPAYRHVEEMTGDEPGNHEDAKGDIADGVPFHIFKYLGEGQEEVDNVHQAENDVSDSGLMVAI